MHSVKEYSSGSNEQTVACFPWPFYLESSSISKYAEQSMGKNTYYWTLAF